MSEIDSVENERYSRKDKWAWISRHWSVGICDFENLKNSSIDELLGNFSVTREQVLAVLDFAAKSSGASWLWLPKAAVLVLGTDHWLSVKDTGRAESAFSREPSRINARIAVNGRS